VRTREFRADPAEYRTHRFRELRGHVPMALLLLAAVLGVIYGRVPPTAFAAVALALCAMPVLAAVVRNEKSRAEFLAYAVQLHDDRVVAFGPHAARSEMRRADVTRITEEPDGRLFLWSRRGWVMVPPWLDGRHDLRESLATWGAISPAQPTSMRTRLLGAQLLLQLVAVLVLGVLFLRTANPEVTALTGGGLLLSVVLQWTRAARILRRRGVPWQATVHFVVLAALVIGRMVWVFSTQQ